jgi:RNA polymerase sigma-70 factor (ECF subfamily)
MTPLAETVIQRADLKRVWGELGSAEREVLFLWAVEGYTIEEIAQQTDTPKGTLLTRLHRMRKRFADGDGQRAAGEKS